MNQKYSPEMREKALRMLDEAKPSHPNLMTAVRHVAGLLGMSAETLRVWGLDPRSWTRCRFGYAASARVADVVSA